MCNTVAMPPDHRADLRAAGAEFKTLRDSLEDARERLVPLMVAALKAGVPQHEVIDMSGYSRANVRTIARQHGIEPAAGGRARRPSSAQAGDDDR